MDLAVLEELGLTKSEVRIYLALVDFGPSRTGPLIRRANVSRSKIYELLNRLTDKGLVSHAIRENTKYFEAAAPENFLQVLSQKREILNAQEENLRALIPQLSTRRKAGAEQTATVYEGYKGIQTVFNEVLATLERGQEYCAFAVEPVYYTKTFSAFIMNYHRRRQEKGIRVKLLSYEAVRRKVEEELGGYAGITLKFTKEKGPVSTLIFGKKVFVFTWKPEPTAILITSEAIACQYRRHFQDIWKRAS